jgi:hypothetical protein
VTGVGGQTTLSFDMTVEASQTYNLDPTAVERLIYSIGLGDPNFANVELPTSGALYLWQDGRWVFGADLMPDTAFDFGGVGVSTFEIVDSNGAASGAPLLTQVTFIGDGTFSGAVTAVATPEPSIWAMMLLGFAGLGYAGYATSRVKLLRRNGGGL